MDKLIEAAKKAIKEHPSFSNQIIELYEMAKTEIEAGESPDNELSLFENSINELLKQKSNE